MDMPLCTVLLSFIHSKYAKSIMGFTPRDYTII